MEVKYRQPLSRAVLENTHLVKAPRPLHDLTLLINVYEFGLLHFLNRLTT